MSALSRLRSVWSRMAGWHGRRAVVTGIGLVSPLGSSVEQFWSGLVNGRSGIDFIRSFDASSFPCQLAAELPPVRFRDFLSRAQIGYYPRAAQLACVAYALAKQNSGIHTFDVDRTDVLVGTASNAFEYIEKEAFRQREASLGTFDPGGITKLNLNCSATSIAAQEKIRGFVGTVTTACASGATVLGLAMERITANLADVVIVGATDVGVTRFLLNLFCAAKFVSFERERPHRAVCPFDIERTRSVLGDGSCFFILEEENAARKRGAHIYGRIAGFRQVYENTSGLFEADATGDPWASTIRSVIERGGPIDYVNAHGTGDQTLDAIEMRALAKAFDGQQSPWISSIKGAIGSPFAAAGAFQVAATLMAMKNGIIPPSCGLERPEPAGALKLVHRGPIQAEIRRALVNSRGLGGVNTALLCEQVAA